MIKGNIIIGVTARIKMVDGVVVSQLYPQHHPLCKPIKLVEAHAMEIEKRCRKDILQGMNPKEAWKKVYSNCFKKLFVLTSEQELGSAKASEL